MIKKIFFFLIFFGLGTIVHAQGCPSFDYGCGCGIPHYVCAGGGGGGSGARAPTVYEWGALIMVPGLGQYYWSDTYSGGQGAYDQAMNACKADHPKKGKYKCELVVYLRRQCFAVAGNTKYTSAHYGNTADQAKERALRVCNNTKTGDCKIIAQKCYFND